MNRAVLVAVVVGAQALVACGGDTSETTVDNQPPVVVVDPTALSVGQGQTASATVTASDPDGSVAGVELTADPALEATLVDDALTVHPSYQLAGPATVTLTATDDAGANTAQPLELQVAPIAWVDNLSWTSAGPEAREHGALIVDDEQRFALLLGGSGYNPYLDPLDDAWRLDLDAGTWSSVTPAGDPMPGGGSRRVAQVPGTKTAYLFGGYGVNGASNGELFRVDYSNGGATITALTQQNAPSARALHAFVYDAAGDRFIMFGGVGSAPLDDTWVMTLSGDTATWTALDLPSKPSPRYGFFYGFDQQLGRLYVFSGAQGTAAINAARDTWMLDVRVEPPVWQLLLDGDLVPPGRRNGATVFDPSGPRMFVFGGTADAMTTEPGLWVFDARPDHAAWTQLALANEPPLRSSGFGIFDPQTQRSWMGFGNTTSAVYQDLQAVGY